VGCAAGCLAAASLSPGCSLGQGSGQATGVIDEPSCWVGPFDLKPDFFAAVPSTNPAGTPTASNALEIRVQNGGDFETFSDGLAIVVDDVAEVRGDSTHPSLLSQPLVVSLPAGVRPVGVPIVPQSNPSIVHATLYLGRSCRTQNVALYAVDAVTLNAGDAGCTPPPGGDPPMVCPSSPIAPDGGAGLDGAVAEAGLAGDAGASVPSPAGAVGSSTITFYSLFDGNPEETNAAARYTDATFHFYLADPREICPGGVGPPPRCRGELTGYFKFYFERGKPAQPFP
jgi:hypothetical protein